MGVVICLFPNRTILKSDNDFFFASSQSVELSIDSAKNSVSAEPVAVEFLFCFGRRLLFRLLFGLLGRLRRCLCLGLMAVTFHPLIQSVELVRRKFIEASLLKVIRRHTILKAAGRLLFLFFLRFLFLRFGLGRRLGLTFRFGRRLGDRRRLGRFLVGTNFQ